MTFGLDVLGKPAVILLCAAVLSTLLRRSSASMRHGVWILALISAVLLPVASAVIPRIDLPIGSEAGASVTVLPIEQAPERVAVDERGLKPGTTYLAARVVRVFGIIFVLVRLILGTVAVRRLAKAAVPVRKENWLHLVQELSVAFRSRRTVRLLSSRQQISPMTWGVLRHTILLPSTADQWSEERRRLVLAHELAHVKRNDGMVQILVQIVCGIYWFNPLVWYAAHRLRIDREQACDAPVLRLGAVAADYADHLIQIVRGVHRHISFAAVSMAQPSQLETRLVAILDSRAPRRTLSKIGTVLLCLFAALLTISIAALGFAAVPLPPVIVAAMKFVPPSPPSPPAAKPVGAPQQTRIGDAGTVPTSAVIPPQVLQSKPPIYTDEARWARIEGTVTLEAAVHVDGSISIL